MKTKLQRISYKIIFIILILSLVSATSYAENIDIAVPYSVDGSAEISFENPISSITLGDTAYAKISISSPPDNLYGYEFKLTYDSSNLKFNSAESTNSDKILTETHDNNGELNIAFLKNDNQVNLKNESIIVKFSTLKTGKTKVNLMTGTLISEDMSYTDYSLNKSINIEVQSKYSSSGTGGGSSGGSSGGTGGGISISGGTNTVTGVSPTSNPSLPSPTIMPQMFNDLEGYEWSYEAIKLLHDMDIINGYEDGTYRPGENITRAEFSKVVAKAFDVQVKQIADCNSNFKDIDNNQWYAPFVLTLSDLGMVKGNEDGLFLPDDYITREDACVIIGRNLESSLIKQNDIILTKDFEDKNQISDYAINYVDMLYSYGIVNGYDGCFKPKDYISRAETAQIFANYFGIDNNSKNQENDLKERILGSKVEFDADNNTYDLEELEELEGIVEEDSDEIDNTIETPVPTEITSEATSSPLTEETEMPTSSIEPSTTPTSSPDIELNPTATPVVSLEPTIRPDKTFDCASLSELNSYSNIYAYLIPDDGSREAFYDDYTTFQRQGDDVAYAVFDVSYAQKAEMTSYFYAGEKLVDFTFEKSVDGEVWTEVPYTSNYLVADGKWTGAVYNIDGLNGSKYLRVNYPQTVNWWTPLISELTLQLGKPYPTGVKIIGKSSLTIPRYDYVDYKYKAILIDQVGEEFDSSLDFYVKNSDIEGLTINKDGTLRIDKSYIDNSRITITAKSDMYNLSGDFDITLQKAILGDLNDDRLVNVEDLEIILKNYYASISDKTWNDCRYSDINEDGIVNIKDIAYVARKAELNKEGAISE